MGFKTGLSTPFPKCGWLSQSVTCQNLPMPVKIRFAISLLVLAPAAFGQSAGANSAADWPLYNRDYASTRFSQLAEITPKNISGLQQSCSYPLPEQAEFESGLVAVNGILRFHQEGIGTYSAAPD